MKKKSSRRKRLVKMAEMQREGGQNALNENQDGEKGAGAATTKVDQDIKKRREKEEGVDMK